MNLKSFLLISLLCFLPFQNGFTETLRSESVKDIVSPEWNDLNKKIEHQIRRFPGESGIFIKDLKTGWTIEHNEQKQFPSASLIKLPIMMVLYKAFGEGKISLDEKLSVLRKEKTRGSGHLKFERSGTKHTIKDLIVRMVTQSDNTATNILTDYMGIDYFRNQFNQLGLKETNFSRRIMDLRKRDLGIENYTTPKEMAILLETLYFKKADYSDEMMEILKQSKINDRLSLAIPFPWKLGHKTGLMRNACHDVGIVFSPSDDYIICVLTTGAHRTRRAKRFISQIAHLTTEYYEGQISVGQTEKSTWNPPAEKPNTPDFDTGKTGG